VRFTIDTTNDGRSSWWLYGDDNETVAWAGESFDTTSDAYRAAVAFKRSAAIARYDVYLDGTGTWRWRARQSVDTVAASGPSFPSYQAAERAATGVRENAGAAKGP
jgi:uncharacterized protein YegP (UPF0339 family)